MQIVDADQRVLSNRVVVDDPVTLAATLTSSASSPRDNRPAELTAGDLDTPLGNALTWLHRNLVMDVSEQAPSVGGAGGVAVDETENPDDDELWNRLEREQLSRDPRASIYGRILKRQAEAGVEPMIEFLEALRARTPGEPAVRHQRSLLERILAEPPSDPRGGDGQPRRWAAATRIRGRARNVLRRWAAAQSDPRLLWVDPLAPAGNFAMIVGAFAHLRLEQTREPERVELTEDDLDDLWARWLRPFAGTGEGDGWLDNLDEASSAQARDRMPEWLPEAAAALCWLIVRPGSGYRERVVAFQPVLAAALSYELVDPTDITARYLHAVTGVPLSRANVEEQLLAAAVFIDDALWCERKGEELGLDRLRLEAPPGAAAIQVRLTVAGIADPLLDPRVPRLVAAARRYRNRDGVAVYADEGWRLVFTTGDTVAFRSGSEGNSTESAVPLARGDLESLGATGGVLADLFPSAEGAAA